MAIHLFPEIDVMSTPEPRGIREKQTCTHCSKHNDLEDNPPIIDLVYFTDFLQYSINIINCEGGMSNKCLL